MNEISIIPIWTKKVGTATDRGFDGADVWLMYRNKKEYYTQMMG